MTGSSPGNAAGRASQRGRRGCARLNTYVACPSASTTYMRTCMYMQGCMYMYNYTRTCTYILPLQLHLRLQHSLSHSYLRRISICINIYA